MEQRIRDLEQRLEDLEVHLRRIAVLGLVLILVVGGLVVHRSWSDLGAITTGAVVFRDDTGGLRSALLVTGSGHLGLIPFRADGTLPPLQPPPGKDLQGIGFYDRHGRLRLAVGLTTDDRPVLNVIGEEGEAVWSPLEEEEAPSEEPAEGTAL